MTMIEKIARAMYEHSIAQRPVLHPPYDEWIVMHPNGQKYWEDFARAAIETLLVPSEKIVERGNDVRGNHDGTWHEGNSTRSVFRSMIDAILTEPPLDK